MNVVLRATTLFVALGAAAGCGGNPNKLPPYGNVTGSVQLDGKPLDDATIAFNVPGNPSAIFKVTAGKFSGQAFAGENTVSVSAKRKKPGATDKLPPEVVGRMKSSGMDVGENAKVDIIPEEWGAKSKQARVVEAGAANNFDIAISGK